MIDRRSIRVAGAVVACLASTPETLWAEPTASVHAPLDLAAQIASLRAASLAADAARQRAEDERTQLSSNANEQRQRAYARARALYRVTRAGSLPLSSGFGAWLEHLARVERLERMVVRDAEELRAIEVRLDALRSEAELRRSEKDAIDERLTPLLAQEEEAVAPTTSYAALWSGRDASGALDLSNSYDPVTGYGLRVTEGAPSSRGFARLRGQLALPLTAPTSIEDATREEGAGLELSGSGGAPVRAAAQGRVVWNDRKPGYGRVVILEHGEGYFTIYGGLGRVDVESGDALSRGMQIGALGNEPLFFQLRSGTRALDARSWLGME